MTKTDIKTKDNIIMKKLLIPLAMLLPILLAFAQPTEALLFMNDTFTRTIIYPWSFGDVSANCTSSAAIVANELQLTTTSANCLSYVGFTTASEMYEYTIDLDYTHSTDAELVIDITDDEGAADSIAIHFNTNDNIIEFWNVNALTHFLALGWKVAYTTNLMTAYPYEFSWSNGQTVHVTIDKSSSSITISFDGTQVAELISPADIFVNMSNPAIAMYRTTGTSVQIDNFAITTPSAILTPTLSIDFQPSSQVGPGESVTAFCTADPLTVPVTLQYPLETTVTNPYTSTFVAGIHWFRCLSNATDQYQAGIEHAFLNVSGDYTTTTTTTTTTIPTDPVAAINETQWIAEGYGWMLPFFSRFFMATMFLIMVLVVAGWMGGPTPAAVAGVALLIAYSVIGIYPLWVLLMLGLITAAVAVYFTRVLGRGGG